MEGTSRLCRWLAFALWGCATVAGLSIALILLGLTKPESAEELRAVEWYVFLAMAVASIALLFVAGRSLLAHARRADRWMTREDIADVFGGATHEPTARSVPTEPHGWHVGAFALAVGSVAFVLLAALMVLGGAPTAEPSTALATSELTMGELVALSGAFVGIAALLWWGHRASLARAQRVLAGMDDVARTFGN